MDPSLKLHKHLLDLEQRTRVSIHDTKNRQLEKDVRSIVVQALEKITKLDERFMCKVHGSGSFYDGVCL